MLVVKDYSFYLFRCRWAILRFKTNTYRYAQFKTSSYDTRKRN